MQRSGLTSHCDNEEFKTLRRKDQTAEAQRDAEREEKAKWGEKGLVIPIPFSEALVVA
jgi:hypothetical protein